MDQYFARMKELSVNDKLPSRIRFMLQDVLELRENQWHPRQSTSRKESPKSIDEIHREAKDEMGIADYQQNDMLRMQFGKCMTSAMVVFYTHILVFTDYLLLIRRSKNSQ